MNGLDSYVLVTAAYNGGKLIEGTIASIVPQVFRLSKWVIFTTKNTEFTNDDTSIPDAG